MDKLPVHLLQLSSMYVIDDMFQKGSWVCSLSSTNAHVNHNSHITDKLEVCLLCVLILIQLRWFRT